MSTTTIDVTGMTCGHCVSAVTSELSAIPGVTAVAVDLHPEGVTPVTITSDSDLDPSAVAAAVDEAGYELAPRP
ncbi:heavy-metal-associated domain-containing protein [Kineosporia sp. J2-2]|uniref:Heavy-metal-associated domain-containing protein n=1 Tax=Kineosporia corallincola TaxID=2835133 RepID=A0ABS5TJN7_9ACTN|nr:heavy-metal-associated domain-containing protein [Kineosporia corallincola]MBT0771316.1 heavy-metal-associated domain-containing protein [Kineosporia corallincola]